MICVGAFDMLYIKGRKIHKLKQYVFFRVSLLLFLTPNRDTFDKMTKSSGIVKPEQRQRKGGFYNKSKISNSYMENLIAFFKSQERS